MELAIRVVLIVYEELHCEGVTTKKWSNFWLPSPQKLGGWGQGWSLSLVFFPPPCQTMALGSYLDDLNFEGLIFLFLLSKDWKKTPTSSDYTERASRPVNRTARSD